MLSFYFQTSKPYEYTNRNGFKANIKTYRNSPIVPDKQPL